MASGCFGYGVKHSGFVHTYICINIMIYGKVIHMQSVLIVYYSASARQPYDDDILIYVAMYILTRFCALTPQ